MLALPLDRSELREFRFERLRRPAFAAPCPSAGSAAAETVLAVESLRAEPPSRVRLSPPQPECPLCLRHGTPACLSTTRIARSQTPRCPCVCLRPCPALALATCKPQFRGSLLSSWLRRSASEIRRDYCSPYPPRAPSPNRN